jgi:hypothetical protein
MSSQCREAPERTGYLARINSGMKFNDGAEVINHIRKAPFESV